MPLIPCTNTINKSPHVEVRGLGVGKGRAISQGTLATLLSAGVWLIASEAQAQESPLTACKNLTGFWQKRVEACTKLIADNKGASEMSRAYYYRSHALMEKAHDTFSKEVADLAQADRRKAVELGVTWGVPWLTPEQKRNLIAMEPPLAPDDQTLCTMNEGEIAQMKTVIAKGDAKQINLKADTLYLKQLMNKMGEKKDDERRVESCR